MQAPVAFARPKSSTLTVPSSRSLIFAGFRSRWMIPCSCAASSASAICFAIGSASSSRNGAACQPLRQILALDEFHHEGLDAVGILEPVDGRDVRVIQGRKDFRFALEPRHSFRVSRDRLWQDLNGDIAIEPRVACSIDFAHPARAEGGDNLVRTEARSSGQGHESRLILVVAPKPSKGETDQAS